MKTQRAINKIKGMTLIEIIVVIAVIALLVAMLLPALVPPRRHTSRLNCTNNLKQIGLSFRIWQGDNNDKYPMEVSVTNGGAMELAEKGIAYSVFQVMSNELSTPKILICPADSEHTSATNFSTGFDNSHLSYFVGLATNYVNPNLIVSGDDNLQVDDIRAHTGILTISMNSSVAWTQERHSGAGNIGLADGSVQSVTSIGLKSWIVTTNRLVIP